MTIYRGPGGTGSATSDADTNLYQQFLEQSLAARDAALQAEVNAELAETNAETAETNAETAATNAANSASSASSSASAAATSASNASSSASAAASSASSASTSATNAANSATAAAASATSAANSASTATTQASNASSSATAAASSASSAATSATNAASSASSASTSATNAANSATSASNSASSAATSATNAANSATSASNSASAAAASASEAAGYAASINPADLVHISGTETITGAKTFSTNPTLSAGTANGVAYLNGSKVLTTGSALTFDGTNLGIGTSSPSQKLDVNGAIKTSMVITNSSLGFRNRIINGDMRIDQRNAGAAITPTDGQFTVDRWKASLNVASKFSLQRSTIAPAGFTNSLLVTSLSSYTVGAGEVTGVMHMIEGFNTADFGWGAAGAQTVTLSFWVRSSLTGTFGGSLRNSASNRSYPFSYTIIAANTFEYKTITIAGDTSGTWLTDNGTGLMLYIALGVGATFSASAGSWQTGNFVSVPSATSVVGTNGATFYITGVQLEAGSVATPFERRPYGTELSLCERYCETSYPAGVAPGTVNSIGIIAVRSVGNDGFIPIRYRTKKRASPTITVYSPATGSAGVFRNIDIGADVAASLAYQGDSGALVIGTVGVSAHVQAHHLSVSEL